MTTIESLMQAVLSATEEQKAAALQLLRGEKVEPAAQPVTGPLVLGMGAAAKFLGVSRATLWRIVQAGRLERVELYSGSYRLRREDLMSLAARKFRDSERRSSCGRPRKVQATEAGA